MVWISTSSTTSVLTSLGFSSTFTALTFSVISSTASVPLNLCKSHVYTFYVRYQGSSSRRMTIVTYFALEELIVGDNQLLFLCSFGNIFDVSEQLVLVEELK